MWIDRKVSAWALLFIASINGAASTALFARPTIAAVQSCTQCNIVEEGIWNQNLINSTVYLYGRDSKQYYPVTVTAVYSNGPYRNIDWYDPGSGRSGRDDATRYYSYRNMQNMRARNIEPPLSQIEVQERNGWLASCASAARSENAFVYWAFRRACCESTAARRYGPHAVCRL
jgi:hypothetical protein